mgnify:CR=1 FL=1
MLEITTSQHCGGEDIICKTLTWISFTVTKGHCSKFYYQSYSMDTYLFKVSKIKSNKHLAGVFLSLNRYLQFYNTVCEISLCKKYKKKCQMFVRSLFWFKTIKFQMTIEKSIWKVEWFFWYTKHSRCFNWNNCIQLGKHFLIHETWTSINTVLIN